MSKPLMPTAAPRLPAAREDYDVKAENEYTRALSLYFFQVDRLTASLLGRIGGKYLSHPYGAFQNAATQAIPAANTPYVVALNTTDFSNGVTLASNQMTVAQGGIYNVQFSLQFENTTAQIGDTFVWLRKNGADIPGTTSTWAVTSTHGGINGYMLGACNFFITLNAGDYLELVVAADITGINIEAYAAQTTPYVRPSTPSSVVTVSFVSNTPS